MKNGEKTEDKEKLRAYIEHCLADEQGSITPGVRCRGEGEGEGRRYVERAGDRTCVSPVYLLRQRGGP